MKEDNLPALPISPVLTSSTPSTPPPSSPPPLSSPSALVRRHHTLSTSAASRLVLSERREARAALSASALTSGLTEEDINYYIPKSPVDSVVAWSDLGHNTTSSTSLNPTPSTFIPTKANTSNRHVRGVSVGGSSTSNNLFGSSSDDSSSKLSMSSPSFHTTNLPSSPPSSRKSSFVVLRGARGDAALTERRTDSNRRLSSASSTGGHRNSLTSFLETDAEGLNQEQEEEWSNGLKDDTSREQDEDIVPQRISPPLSSNSTFHLPARANTLSHTRSISSVTSSDAWHSKEVSSVLRRPQSLNFRNNPATKSDSWRSHDRGQSEGYSMSGPSPPPPPPVASSSSYSSRSPIPFSEPTTPHNTTGLSHSNSYSSQHSNTNRDRSGATGLSHSNSFGSHHSHHSISNGVVAGNGPLSPVGGFVRSPWSPTREETQAMASSGSGISGSPPKSSGILNREGSSSSKGSGAFIDEDDEAADGIIVSELISRNSIKMGDRSNGRSSRSILNTSTDALRSTSPSSSSPSRRLPPLLTNPDVLSSKSRSSRPGPASASPFVPPIGHSHLQALSSPQIYQQQHPSTHPSFHQSYTSSTNHRYKGDKNRSQTAQPGSASSLEWKRQKDLLIGSSASSTGATNGENSSNSSTINGGTENNWPPSGGFGVGLAIQQQQQIQVLQNQMMQAMQAMENMKLNSGLINYGGGAGYNNNNNSSNLNMSLNSNLGVGGMNNGYEFDTSDDREENGVGNMMEDSPVDIPTLIREKGYNPISFDLKPANARFFVIKSYTEEDVHKSLKHEIWASTDLGNKRLDKAFKENELKGPIYLFFSVNGSGHFAGVARMISAVDYTTSSTVWASDKWKGIFKVQWIYIKDVPLASLRHIRLSNTPENKPVTSSRDTQEVPYESGCEVLRILSTYLARTSLLQDFAWYEARTDESTAANTTTSAVGGDTSTSSTAATSSTTPQNHYGPRANSISNPLQSSLQGNNNNYLQQPFQFQSPQQQFYNAQNTNNNNNNQFLKNSSSNALNFSNSSNNLNYQQQQHQAHFVPPPFQQQQSLNLHQQQQLHSQNPFQFTNSILIQQHQLQQQQLLFQQQQQQYYNNNVQTHLNHQKNNTNNNNNKVAGGSNCRKSK